MSTLKVATIQTPDETTPLTLQTGNLSGAKLILNDANDTIYLFGTLNGLTFPEVNTAVAFAYASANDAANIAYTTANNAANVAYAAADAANAAAAQGITTGKAIAMAIVFG